VCIRWLIRYVSTHDFTIFAWYRIVFGGHRAVSAYTGWVLGPEPPVERL
jgi:undecaprenyl-diphosphatase